ncbi:cytochrome P450 [Streptomyces sp. CA-210063]|uniref:cytochrome P450 n=1 Tax=Streptomyces sp. CA-210063 TaxID=2801029 RepID=UPI00214ABEB9|nr:cytochrome P450 [Streptomyces sp. CA-210063]UUU31136.1 cytochrome P450 [Streptomyces sp. CA-210063]
MSHARTSVAAQSHRAHCAPPLLPGALPLVGHALRLLNDPADFLTRAPAHGPLARVRLGTLTATLVSDPALTRQVLLDDALFDKGGPLYDRIRDVMGNGLLSCPHTDHRRQRRLLQPAFHKDRLPAHLDLMAHEITDSVARWRDDQVVDMAAQAQALTARAIVATLFDGTLGPATVDAMVEDMAAITAGIYTHALLPTAYTRLPLPAHRRYSHAQKHLRVILGRIIAEHRSRTTDHGDFLTLLTSAGTEGPALSDREISDQVITFFIAGMETTGNALAWAAHHLAQDPELQRGVHAEAAALPSGPLSHTSLPHLELTGRVVTEALRHYPPVWFLTRNVTRDTELGGHPLRSGDTVVISAHLVQHLASAHPRPETFDPGRWVSPHSGQPVPGSFIPFGLGSRKCIGDALGVGELTLALAALARRWHLEPVTTAPVRFAKDIVIRPRDLRLRVHAHHTT